MTRIGEAILRACAGAAARTPWTVVAICLALTVAAGFASRTLTLDTGIESILSPELPSQQAEARYAASFPLDELVVVVVDSASPAAAGDAAERLAAALGARPALFSDVEVVGASPFFERHALLFLAPERIAALAEELREARRLLTTLAGDPTLRGAAELLGLVSSGVAEGLAPPEAAGLLDDFAEVAEARATGEPAAIRWADLFAAGPEAGTRRLVQAKPALDDTSFDRAGPALAALQAAMREVRAAVPEVELRATGLPVLRQQELNDVFSGALYASGLSFVLVALSLILGIRSGRLVAALLLTLVAGSIWTTGLAALTVGRLNLISSAFLVLFFGLGVDFGTHLGLRYLEEARGGRPFRDALSAAMLGEAPGIVLSAVCAALAFLAFVPTAYTGMAEFGIISALGMAVAVVATFTLQPALMALMPPKPGAGGGAAIGIGGAIVRHRRAILAAAALVTVAAAFLAPRAGFDLDPLNLQNPEAEPVLAYRDLAADPETSPYALNVAAPDADAAGALAERLAQVEGVAAVRSLADFVPPDQSARLTALAAARERIGRAFFAPEPPPPPPDDASLSRAFADMRRIAGELAATPDQPEIATAAARLDRALATFAERRGTEPAALAELGRALAGDMPDLVATLREQLSVAAPVTADDIPEDLRHDWINARGEVRLTVLPADDLDNPDELRRFTKAVQAIAPFAAGPPNSISGAAEAITSAFFEAVLYTALAIALVVAMLRRRLLDVVLVLTPLAVAALWTLAASALLDLPFNFANMLVIPLIIGLGVAGSIHIVVRAGERTGADPAGGAGVLATSTPLAVLIAQLNTVCAFATLAVSKHYGLYSMGLLLGIAIFFVLIACLVVLPAFMVTVQRSGPARGGAG